MPTNNPVPSRDPSDLPFNAEKLDQVVNSTSNTFTDRKGVVRKTLAGILDLATTAINAAVYSLASVNNRGAWAATTVYAVKDLVLQGGTWYVAVLPHTSAASFAIDQATKWRVYQGVIAGDLSASGGAATVGFTQAGLGAGSRRVEDKLREVVSFRDFLCDDGQFVQLDGVHEDATGIQKALDYARLSGRHCRAGTAGIALLEQRVFFPDGVNFRGEGNPEMDGYIRGTIFKAGPGFSSGSVLGVRGHTGGTRRFWGGYLGHFSVHGNASATNQSGLEFTDDLGRLICPQDTSLIECIFVRYCPSGGGFFPDGILPGTIRNFRPLWNGGPGLRIYNNGQPNTMVDIYGLSGDGNNGGLLYLKDFNEYNTVNLYGMKAECYDSPDFPGGDQQFNVIALQNCGGMRLNLFGPHAISAVPDGANFKKPGDLVRIVSGGPPSLNWIGADIRVRGTDTGPTPSIISYGGTTVPYTVPTGSFGVEGEQRADAAKDGYRLHVVGGGSYANRSIESGGHQVAGITPAYTLHETDAGADGKTWIMAASAGALTRRVVSDSGATSTYETVSRSGGVPFQILWSVPVGPGLWTIASLPGAASRPNTLAMVSNPAASKGRLVYSDGAAWRYVSDDSTV